MGRTTDLCQRLNLRTHIPIYKVCADFYLLERMNSVGYKPAVRAFRLFQDMVAAEFSRYLDLVIGGELRHANGQPRITKPLSLASVLEAYNSLDNDRTDCWLFWQEWRKTNPDPRLLIDAACVFEDEEWTAGGAGGPAWGTACRVLADYYSGKLTKTAFIDRCFTLYHNYAIIFDKLYMVDRLASVLRDQAEDRYDSLTSAASRHTVKMYTAWQNSTRWNRDPVWLGRVVEDIMSEDDVARMWEEYNARA